ncbi:hypothetical protein [Adhaeretor mobilis]|uniref:Uncharacterized protein n=1 Tax=Adhaeretor mobilis TaxID=1930276 RepID=A0A517N2Q1_9BACT|nr:hypothetical protein [Adhaeretor mobilis]QDT01403.1 hypothetical protein HG15A2_47450 [Adhaeretor mobilis]
MIRTRNLLLSLTLGILAGASSALETAAQHYQHAQTLMASVHYDGNVFGTHVEIEGDLVIVRSGTRYATSDVPRTHIFQPSTEGIWEETHLIGYDDLLPPGDSFADRFTRGLYIGQETALSNGTIIIGQTFGDLGSHLDAVTFAELGEHGWQASKPGLKTPAMLEYSPGYTAPGRSVAISGETAIAGDTHGSRDGRSSDNEGVILVYEKDNSGQWRAEQLISPNNFGSFSMSQIGYSVDLSGDTAISITHPGSRIGAGTRSVGLYFFDRDSSGQWTQTDQFAFEAENRLPPPEEFTLLDSFRSGSIRLEGDVAVLRGVDESLIMTRTLQQAGGTPAKWEESTRLQGANSSSGRTVDIEGNILAIGMAGETGEPNRVELYRRDTQNSWNIFDTITSPDSDYDPFFGTSVSLDNGRLLVGAGPYLGTSEVPGAAFLFVNVPEPASAFLLVLSLALLAPKRTRRLVPHNR